MSIQVTTTCPHCRATLDFQIGIAAGTTIGPPIANCPGCGGAFRTGQSEWVDKTPLQRAGYWARVFWWWLGAMMLLGVMGTLVLVGGAAYAGWLSTAQIPIAAVGTATGLAATFVMILIRRARTEIRQSVRRTGGRERA